MEGKTENKTRICKSEKSMNAPESPKRDANEERITKLEASQDALMKKIEGMDAYFKDPEGMTKQIEKTVQDSMLEGLKAYDKTVQERFATRQEARQGPGNQGSSAAGSPATGERGGGMLDGLDLKEIIKGVVDGVRGGGPRTPDPNYATFLTIRDDMMGKALQGIGRGLGKGVEKEVVHLVKFD